MGPRQVVCRGEILSSLGDEFIFPSTTVNELTLSGTGNGHVRIGNLGPTTGKFNIEAGLRNNWCRNCIARAL